MPSLILPWSIRLRLVYSTPHQSRLPLYYEYVEQRLQVWEALYSPEQFQGCAASLLRYYCSRQALEFCLYVRIGERIALMSFRIDRVRHQALTRYGGYLHATVAFLRKALRKLLVFVNSHLRNQRTQRRVPYALRGEAGGCDRAIMERHCH